MLEGMYFWKDKNGTVSKLKLILGILLILILVIGGGAGAWYYFVKLPEAKAKEEAIARQQQAAQKLRDDIEKVKGFYASSLAGGGIDETVLLLDEIKKSDKTLDMIPLDKYAFTCDSKACKFSYAFTKGTVWALPKKSFWGKWYKPTVITKAKGKSSAKNKMDFQFDKVESRLNKNNYLQAYSQKKPLELNACSDVVSYIMTFNSLVKSQSKNSKDIGQIVIKKMPGSSISDLESTLSGKVKAYGMQVGKWELEIKKGDNVLSSDDMTNMQLLLYKQAYRDAFIVNKLETKDKGLKVSGGLVCKK
ncbi:hypothetical protein M8S10_10030 [Enterobacter chuandaensis]|uniref:hypothetical protein n=1 Tax=Enterobacter chuandaensis TaxID=2497875 RepID=UPI0020753A5E|nr:hypothetical protein [Enterobacter chuandaensis]MCM7589154.1 hypothetical protein [Enterobacter chuandaensis]